MSRNWWKQEEESTYTPVRSYCHPVDADMIRVLDNPISRTAIAKLVEISADVNWGHTVATAVSITEENEPELHGILKKCASLLRIPMPYMVLSSDIGFNAYTVGSDKKPYIILGSMLVKNMSREQLTFVIGHECGHIAMGHLIYHTAATTLTMFAEKIPVVGDLVDTALGLALKAWNRRSEVTADRAGMLCCGSKEVAERSLLQIVSEFIDAGTLNVEAYVKDSREYRSGSVIRRLGECKKEHPIIAKRIECIDLFAQSSLLFRVFGEEAPEGAMNDRDLKNNVERVLRVV